MCLLKSRIGNKFVLNIFYVKLILSLYRFKPDNFIIIEIQWPRKVICTDFQHHLSLLSVFASPHILLCVDVIHPFLLLCFFVLDIEPNTGKFILKGTYTHIHALDSFVINVHGGVQKLRGEFPEFIVDTGIGFAINNFNWNIKSIFCVDFLS